MKRDREEDRQKTIWEIIEHGSPADLREFLQDIPEVKGLCNDKKETPLYLAIKLEKVEMVKLLLQKGADPLKRIYREEEYFAGLASNNKEIRQLMLDAYPVNDLYIKMEMSRDGNDPTTYFTTPLSYSIDVENEEEKLQLLLDNGANPNTQDGAGKTALHYCFNRLQAQTIDLLLKYGADPKIHDREGMTPLHYLMDWMRCNEEELTIEIAKKFIDKGCNVNAQDIESNTPLHYAAFQRGGFKLTHGDGSSPHTGDVTATLKALRKLGANAALTNQLGNLPLHNAAYVYAINACEELLTNVNNGWNLNLQGHSPVMNMIQGTVDPFEHFAKSAYYTKGIVLEIFLLFLTKATNYRQVAMLCQPILVEDEDTDDSRYEQPLLKKSKISKYLKIAVFYGTTMLINQEEYSQDVTIFNSLSAQGSQITTEQCAPFYYHSLGTHLSNDYNISFHPKMLDCFKNEIMKNPNANAFRHFVYLHEGIVSLQELFQKGTPIKIYWPTKYRISLALIAEIYLCTSGLANNTSCLPLELQEIIIANFLQVPGEFLPYLQNQPSQDSGMSKQ